MLLSGTVPTRRGHDGAEFARLGREQIIIGDDHDVHHSWGRQRGGNRVRRERPRQCRAMLAGRVRESGLGQLRTFDGNHDRPVHRAYRVSPGLDHAAYPRQTVRNTVRRDGDRTELTEEDT